VVAAVGVSRTHGVPRDARAARAAAQTYTLAEFLETRTPGWTPPKLDQPLLMHGHWHERCVLDFTAQQRLLNTTTTAVDIPANGCCGMAGAFGFEADHYDVAITVGEQALLPAVRAADPRTVVVADGFSCHEQIRQGTGRVPVHLAEVLAAGLTGEHP